MIPFPDKKYQIILADPPWAFSAWNPKTAHRYIENHYATMSLKDINELPIRKITDSCAALFLWVTFPNLVQGIETIKEWGFTYKTCAFTWIKKNSKSDSLFWGMGYYTRSNAELCLLGIKGKPLKRLSHSIHSVIEHSIMRHSKKPPIVRDNIVKLFGDLPRIELFARQRTEGWDSWGLEVDVEISAKRIEAEASQLKLFR